jgi:hypothetical protein
MQYGLYVIWKTFAIPIGIPGWPELAFCTASILKKRMALARSRRVGSDMHFPLIEIKNLERNIT